MARRRRAKRPRLLDAEQIAQLAEAARDSESESEEDTQTHAAAIARTNEIDTSAKFQSAFSARNKVVNNRLRGDQEEPQDEEHLRTLKWCEENLAFCCAICKCSADMKKDPNEDDLLKQDNIDYPYIFVDSSEQGYAHRKCCHNALLREVQTDWATSFEAASATAVEAFSNFSLLNSPDFRIDPAPLEWVTMQEIKHAYSTAKSQESALYNADAEVRK